jgi:hypothetical protein
LKTKKLESEIAFPVGGIDQDFWGILIMNSFKIWKRYTFIYNQKEKNVFVSFEELNCSLLLGTPRPLPPNVFCVC